MGPLDRPTFTTLVQLLDPLVTTGAAHARPPPKGFLKQGCDSDNNRLSDVFELQAMQKIVEAKGGSGDSGGGGFGKGGVIMRDRSKSVMRTRQVQQGMLIEDDGEGEVYAELDEADDATYGVPDGDNAVGETRFGHAPREPREDMPGGPAVPERPSLQPGTQRPLSSNSNSGRGAKPGMGGSVYGNEVFNVAP